MSQSHRAWLLAGASIVAAGLTGAASAAAQVHAIRETDPVASLDDAADDPAIWRNPADPAASLIVATDKKAGLNVYGLDGRRRASIAAGRVNNVDLRADVDIAGAPGVLVAASDRNDATHGVLALFKLSTPDGALTEIARIPADVTEAYGFCLWRRASDRAVFAFVVAKDGAISQLQVDASGAAPTAKVVRKLKLATQSEGCVADDRTGLLYVGEEDVGVWRFQADPSASPTGELTARADGVHLAADAEGLAIAAEGADGGYLVVSSQGDSAFTLYRLGDMAFVGRFLVTPGPNGVDGTSETDGLEISTAGFGPDFPGGLVVAQDGDNSPEAQNFKLIAWDEVRKALALP
ncbi:phytase [Phenylobacterium sp.]|uniref:phytase n=1 Tax=Phenylobacterium sp. TaxID=1871053 RepID=UPI0035AFCF36